MTYTPADVFEILKRIRYDATAIQAKVTEAMEALASLNLPEDETPRKPCPECGLALPPRRLEEHLYIVHDVEPQEATL